MQNRTRQIDIVDFTNNKPHSKYHLGKVEKYRANEKVTLGEESNGAGIRKMVATLLSCVSQRAGKCDHWLGRSLWREEMLRARKSECMVAAFKLSGFPGHIRGVCTSKWKNGKLEAKNFQIWKEWQEVKQKQSIAFIPKVFHIKTLLFHISKLKNVISLFSLPCR